MMHISWKKKEKYNNKESMSNINIQEQPAQQRWEQPVDIPVGEILRRARAHYGLSLMDVEQALRIRASQLEALEMMDMNRLPGRVYAIGFVRSYSEFLGLDGGRMVHLFKTQVMDGGQRMATMNYSADASESKVPNVFILGGSFIALLAIMATAFFMAGDDKPQLDDIPSISVAQGLDHSAVMNFASTQPLQGAVMAAIEPAAGLEQSAQMVAPEPQMPQIVMKIIGESWVEVRDEKGKTVISKVFKPGDRYEMPANSKGWELSTGNAGGLVFVVNGEELPALGEKGDVLRHVELDGDALWGLVDTATLDSAADTEDDTGAIAAQ